MNPHLLLLHGALGTRESFKPFADMLAQNFTLHAIDFAGHGESVLGDRAFTMATFADEVIEYLDKNNIDSTDIFGYSMGGYVGLQLCHTHPTRVKRLFTLGTKIFWTEAVAETETAKLDPEKILAKVPVFAEELQRRHKQTDWKEMLSITREMMMELGKNNLLKEEVLKSIQQPVCIAIGDKDNTVPHEEAIAAYKSLPQGQMAILPATPHPLEKVSPELLSIMLKRFFS